MTKNVAIYVRLSISREESVSIDRQLKACRALAESRGWNVVAEFKDDGVSASKNKPEDRAGWSALLERSAEFDAVIVWKIDRLARRVLDFLNANAAIAATGGGIVAVEDPIDMTTAQGRAFAVVLAVFAELEAEAISARVLAARDYCIGVGRWVGGAAPYGYRLIDNPDGKGKVLRKDAARIKWVEGMAKRALDGDSIYSVVQWLNEKNAPIPTVSQKKRRREGWNYTTVERLLRNPILAGMTPFNPGKAKSDSSPLDPSAVVRDDDGLPVINEKLAVLSSEDWRAMLDKIDNRDSAQARSVSTRTKTSPFLSGVFVCGDCGDRNMRRGTHGGRETIHCVACHQIAPRRQLDPLVAEMLLTERGDEPILQATRTTTPDRSVELSDVEDAIRAVTVAMTADDADVPALVAKLDGLKAIRSKARKAKPTTEEVWEYTGQTVREAWEAAGDDDVERRRILLTQLESASIRRGGRGRYFDSKRVTVTWKPGFATHFPHLTTRRDAS